MLNITVLTGGSTPERDVALAGAAEVVRALRSRGHRVNIVDIAVGPLSQEQGSNLLNPAVDREPPSLAMLQALRENEDWLQIINEPALHEADVIFPLLHGREVEGGLLQSLLEIAGLRFVGSDMRGSLLAMDKNLTKQLCRAAGIPTADWAKWPAPEADIAQLGWPLIVKPARAGSTVGLSLVNTMEELPAAIAQALTVDSEVLLERFIAGRELTVGILGEQTLAVGEIIPQHAIFDYECKYTPGMCQEIFPADIDPELHERITLLALEVHRLLRLRHFSRIDFRVSEEGVCYCLEANTLPGLTQNSLVPKAAVAVGISFAEFCERICQLALQD